MDDRIVRADIFNVTATPASLVSTLWFNATTGTNIAAPNPADLSYLGTVAGALEATQLMVKAAVESAAAGIGTPSDAAASGNSVTASLIAFIKRLCTLTSTTNTALGVLADAAAGSDAGSYSIIAFIKRGMQNWTTLLGRIPALVGGKVPTEVLGKPTVARQLTTGASSASVTLTAGVTRISIRQRSGDARYRIGSGSQTATATDHFIADGERLDLQVDAGSTIAAIRDGLLDGVLEITELA